MAKEPSETYRTSSRLAGLRRAFADMSDQSQDTGLSFLSDGGELAALIVAYDWETSKQDSRNAGGCSSGK